MRSTPPDVTGTGHYGGAMNVAASDVATSLRARVPGIGAKKLHKLLYYAQGHHLATFGVPLFADTVSAWDMGPVVGRLWKAERDQGVPQSVVGAAREVESRLTEAQLNTIGYVVSRYGALTGRDLEVLTHGEGPWRRADALRSPGGSARIEPAWMQEYFAQAGDDEDEPPLDSEAVRAWLKETAPPTERRPDSAGALADRLAQLR